MDKRSELIPEKRRVSGISEKRRVSGTANARRVSGVAENRRVSNAELIRKKKQTVSGVSLTHVESGVARKAVTNLDEVEKMFISLRYFTCEKTFRFDHQEAPELWSFPDSTKDHIIVRDLLCTLLGVEGAYVRSRNRQLQGDLRGAGEVTIIGFHVAQDAVLLPHAEFVERIGTVSSFYVYLTRCSALFNSSRWGSVAQSFACCIDSVLHEYSTLVCQIEALYSQRRLSLHKLWYYIQTFIPTLRILTQLCIAIETMELRGGALVNLIQYASHALSSDRNSEQLFAYILEECSRPYLLILSKWIYQGILEDAHDEFLVCHASSDDDDENNVLENVSDSYHWQKCYYLRKPSNDDSATTNGYSFVPKFLLSLEEKILMTGKYLNVLRQSGREVPQKGNIIIQTGTMDVYARHIEAAHTTASAALMTMLKNDKSLFLHLRVLRSIFLIQSGDFVCHFLDMAEEELRKPVSSIRFQQLSALVAFAVKSCSLFAGDGSEELSWEAFSDIVGCKLEPTSALLSLLNRKQLAVEGAGNLSKQVIVEAAPSSGKSPIAISGIESVSLTYAVEFPLSIILHEDCIGSYQLLFRHLFRVRSVERRLSQLWGLLSLTPKLNIVGSQSLLAITRLSHTMIHFVRTLQCHFNLEAIEENYRLLWKSLQQVTTVDDILSVHDAFLLSCSKSSLLTHHTMLLILYKMFSIAEMFCRFLTQRLQPIFRVTENYQLKLSELMSKRASAEKNLAVRRRMCRRELHEVGI